MDEAPFGTHQTPPVRFGKLGEMQRLTAFVDVRDVAGIDGNVADERAQKGRLAGARFADQTEHLTGIEIERHIPARGMNAVALVHIAYAQERCHAAPRCCSQKSVSEQIHSRSPWSPTTTSSK